MNLKTEQDISENRLILSAFLSDDEISQIVLLVKKVKAKNGVDGEWVSDKVKKIMGPLKPNEVRSFNKVKMVLEDMLEGSM